MASDIENTTDRTRQSILARLRTETAPGFRLRGVFVNEGQITDANLVPTDDLGRPIPYICVVFGGRGKVAQGQRGIVTVRQDLKRMVFGVECYDYTKGGADILGDRVSDVLEGFEPTDGGEIGEINSGRIDNPADVKQNHARIGTGLLFDLMVNTRTVDLTP